MTNFGIGSTYRLVLTTLVALAFCGCKSGPTATDYLEDAERALKASQLDEAQTYLEMAEEKGTSSRRASIMSADIERRLGERAEERDQFEEAFDHYKEAGDREPRRKERAAAYLRAVGIGQKAGMSPERLAPVAQRAVDADPSSARAHRLNGQLWDEAGRPKKAVPSYLWLWQADNSRTDVGRRLAVLYRPVGRRRDAASILRQLLESDSDNPQAILNLAQINTEMGKTGRARKLYEHLVEEHGDKPGILLQYARFLERQGEIEHAERLKKKAYEQMPGVEKREMRELR